MIVALLAAAALQGAPDPHIVGDMSLEPVEAVDSTTPAPCIILGPGSIFIWRGGSCSGHALRCGDILFDRRSSVVVLNGRVCALHHRQPKP